MEKFTSSITRWKLNQRLFIALMFPMKNKIRQPLDNSLDRQLLGRIQGLLPPSLAMPSGDTTDKKGVCT